MWMISLLWLVFWSFGSGKFDSIQKHQRIYWEAKGYFLQLSYLTFLTYSDSPSFGHYEVDIIYLPLQIYSPPFFWYWLCAPCPLISGGSHPMGNPVGIIEEVRKMRSGYVGVFILLAPLWSPLTGCVLCWRLMNPEPSPCPCGPEVSAVISTSALHSSLSHGKQPWIKCPLCNSLHFHFSSQCVTCFLLLTGLRNTASSFRILLLSLLSFLCHSLDSNF